MVARLYSRRLSSSTTLPVGASICSSLGWVWREGPGKYTQWALPMQGRSEKIGPERSSPRTKHMGDYYFSLYTSFHRYTQSLDLYCERPSVSSAVDIQTGCILQDGLAEHSRYQPKASSYVCSVLFTGMIGNARSLAHLACRAEGPRVDPRNNRRRLSTPDTPPRKIRPAFTAYISQGGG